MDRDLTRIINPTSIATRITVEGNEEAQALLPNNLCLNCS
jgi:hypothetical protein